MGHMVASLHSRFPSARVLGIDYFMDNIRAAAYLHPGLKESFFAMSVYDLAFGDRKADTVLLLEVIEHLEAPGKALDEIGRVLKEGGALIVSTNNPYYWRDVWAFLVAEMKNLVKGMLGRKKVLDTVIFYHNVEWNRHIYCWTPSTLMTLLKIHGFEYVTHTFASPASWPDRVMATFFPFLGSTEIIKVRKEPGR